MSEATLYHNPRCSTSRKALEMLRERGIEPTIVEYLKTPPSAEQLQEMAKASGQPLRSLVRTKQPEYLEQGLDRSDLSDAQLAQALHDTPVLIERPILATAKGVRLGRPVEQILEVL